MRGMKQPKVPLPLRDTELLVTKLSPYYLESNATEITTTVDIPGTQAHIDLPSCRILPRAFGHCLVHWCREIGRKGGRERDREIENKNDKEMGERRK